MINIQLTPAMFSSGGLFYGTDRSRAVLVIGAARNDIIVGKRNTGNLDSFNYRGFKAGIFIDARGTEIENTMLETIMKNEDYRCTYGTQLLDFVEKGYIQVYQDGVLVPANTLRNYTAP